MKPQRLFIRHLYSGLVFLNSAHNTAIFNYPEKHLIFAGYCVIISENRNRQKRYH